ncbi:uridine kinase [Anaerosporobacter mobilis DSM 15930]|uniref:Uridine kinase n=1 Tax=Anaerosporobacter mobilis DSM 15930 TaxID=1120996 RepID=A0A1M7K0G2_9FIRM|nr:nucleoside kinase [Anaerosporobacter mobilis]SHM58695.1 uridine kinase [Anaerosporobacter mobilis DSM 15930]
MSINVIINGETKVYEENTSLLEISKDFQKDYQEDIILAFVDNKLRELFKTVTKDCTVRFVTTKDSAGRKTYKRGMTLVLLKAIHDEIGNLNVEKVLVEYSIGSGYYCEIKSDAILDEALIERIEARMRKIIADDIPFQKRSITTDEAIELFKNYRMYDKEKLFRYRRVSKANIYKLGGFEDYFYGYMPPRTGMLQYFKLYKYDDGLIMQLPSDEDPRVVPPFEPRHKLFGVLKESNRWGNTMKIETVGALNDVICKGGINDLILVQEALQEKKIGEIAEQIVANRTNKFIMISGPSSSGKTTFSHRLSIELRTHGMNPLPIALDNYFVDRMNTPLDAEGNPNFECLEAIDIEQFNNDMMKLLNGERVELPSYNFKLGKREYKGNYQQLGEDDILVIEGIHGLNDKLSHSLPKESKFKIYISALTQLNIDEHNRIPTTDGRLIRRMVRDARTRGIAAKDTIAMWASVRRGEEENIFPFQEEADVMFNSALIYELAILKLYAEPILFGIDRECTEYVEAKRLLKFLDYFIGVSPEEVPRNSIIREFVGGSYFKVD